MSHIVLHKRNICPTFLSIDSVSREEVKSSLLCLQSKKKKKETDSDFKSLTHRSILRIDCHVNRFNKHIWKEPWMMITLLVAEVFILSLLWCSLQLQMMITTFLFPFPFLKFFYLLALCVFWHVVIHHVGATKTTQIKTQPRTVGMIDGRGRQSCSVLH